MTKTSMQRRQFAFWCVFGLGLCLMRPAAAARLLDVYIEQDGKIVVHTYYDDGGRADASTVWRYLKTPPIMVDDDVTNLAVAAEDPLNVKLTGDLEIRIQHSDAIIARTRLSSLLLRREDQQTQAWFLSESEVERTAFIAGLGPASGAAGVGSLDEHLLTIAVCLLILVSCVLITFFLLRGPRTGTA